MCRHLHVTSMLTPSRQRVVYATQMSGTYDPLAARRVAASVRISLKIMM